nr:DUF3562 domain-containing protein [uncultured Cupriavidus sp.]
MSHFHATTEAASTDQAATVQDNPVATKNRPSAGEDAIERIASALGLPVDQVRWQFWNAWDRLLVDAKFPDYLLVLSERKTRDALRRQKQVHH